MLEYKDPAFKLFGKTIPVAGDGEESPRESTYSSNSDQQEVDMDFSEEESMEVDQVDDLSPGAKEETADPPPSSMPEPDDQNPKEIDSEKDSESPKEEKNSQQKPLKKPDKILPCPRCNSMDTKLCYYNNYNVNQPRHFCKSCQRYWTAGGTMRNVPVGAGRRKNKTSSRYCHITVSELDVTNRVHHTGLKPNGTVLTFGSDSPLYDDHSNASTVTTSSMDNTLKNGPQEPIANQVPCFQWPYMWNPSSVPIAPFCPLSPPGFPMSFYPTPYWNGAIPWNVPWVSSSCSPGQKSPGSNPNYPTLGKHSRDNEKSPSTVLVPKTLRIDDPDEAAKSSIWTTLGIHKEKGDHLGGKKGFFNRYQTKGEEKDHKMETPQALKANPAALSRSINFQESASR